MKKKRRCCIEGCTSEVIPDDIMCPRCESIYYDAMIEARFEKEEMEAM